MTSLNRLDSSAALERCAAYAVEHRLTPPAQLTNEDGTLSDEAARFRLDSRLTYDWMFIGQGQKHWRAQA